MGSTAPASSAPRSYRLVRSGDRDLLFDGYLLGQARRNEVVGVAIYSTVGGKYVTHVERLAVRKNEGFTGKSAGRFSRTPPFIGQKESKVGIHDTPEGALAWLVADNGKLGDVSKEAWENACRAWPALKGYDVEVIE
jgi:hypothetical protein